MTQANQNQLTDKDGLRGTLAPTTQNDAMGQQQVQVQLENGSQVLVPANLLTQSGPGEFYLPLSLAELGQNATAAASAASSQSATSGKETLVIPVIAEELLVEKRQVVTGKVRLKKTVKEHEEVVDEPLLQEEFKVERVAINQVVDTAPSVRYEGDTMIISLLEEVLVVEKRLMLKEELHVTKQTSTVNRPQSFTLRSEEVVVDKLPAANANSDVLQSASTPADPNANPQR